MRPAIRIGAAALALSALAAVPASASAFVDRFFDAVKKIHPEPDQVEMTRYWIVAPGHAHNVYTRVIAQDYGYIGLLAAAKAARDRKIPGTDRTFDYHTCQTPIHAFDAIFAESGEYMDEHQDDPRVQAYLQAQNEEAKEQAAEQMAAYVPYWGDIPHICHFAFKTDFTVEADFREHLLRARTLKESFEAFSGGDVVTGTTKLIKVGVSESAACVFADESLSGGYVSKTPLVGELAMGICKGFAGQVIGAVGDAVGAGYDAVNNLGDEIAGQDKHMPQQAYYDTHWKPRLEEGVAHIRAGKWGPFLALLWEPCADYFDSHTMSRANAQKTCDRFRDTFTAEATRLQQEQDKAAADAALAAANAAEIDRNLPGWRTAFVKKWAPQCEEPTCNREIQRLAAKATEQGRATKTTHPLQGWAYVHSSLQAFHGFAAEEIARSKKRDADVNREITDDASEVWALLLVKKYTPQCADEPCRRYVSQLGDQYVARQKALQREHPEESSLAIQKRISGEFGPRFQKLIDDSHARVKVASSRNASPDERLSALGCKRFLGREGNWLCYDLPAYDACVRYVNGGEAKECRHPPTKKEYLGRAGGRTGGAPIRIGGDPAERLRPLGCKFFLGRKDNYLCTTDAGYDACVDFKEKGRVVACQRAGRR